MSENTAFNDTDLNSIITEVALSIGAYKDGKYIVSGTATFIAPRLLITAKHVIEHYWREYKHNILNNGEIGVLSELQGNFNILAVQIIDNGKQGATWDVRQIFIAPNTDIAFLSVIPASDAARNYKFKIPKIEILPPRVGSRISCFGYRQSRAEITKNIIEWEYIPTSSLGVVIDIHQHKRDNFSINFPCIYTNARYDGGMSGGPVFNDEGNLCAIISSNLPPTTPKEEHASYAALIWPSMITSINLEREGTNSNRHYPILELCQDKIITAQNYDRVKLIDTEQGIHTSIELYIPRERFPETY